MLCNLDNIPSSLHNTELSSRPHDSLAYSLFFVYLASQLARSLTPLSASISTPAPTTPAFAGMIALQLI